MAQKFEIVFPCDQAIHMADDSFKKWTYDDIVKVVESHNCKWIIAKHPADMDGKAGSLEQVYCNFDHWHCGIHTSSNNEYATIAKWFGLETNSVNKILGKFDSTYALYLIHYNATYEDGTPKPAIPKEDVHTNFQLDYDKLIGKIETGNASADILAKIASGELKRYQFSRELSDAFRIKYYTQINHALEIAHERRMQGERTMAKDVIWIYGNAGLGKTELAKYLAKTKFGELDYFMSDSGDNPFDNYADQPCVVLDDVGTDNLNSKVVLKLFDPYNKCFTKARYFNRAIDADMIIVTSSMDPRTFWESCRNTYNANGSWEQLLRRLTGGVIHILDKDTFELTMYDDKGTNPKVVVCAIPDPVKAHTVTVTAEARINNVMSRFNFTATKTKDDTVQYSGEFKQMHLDETPWAPAPANRRRGATSGKTKGRKKND